jgi:hypothetical protein
MVSALALCCAPNPATGGAPDPISEAELSGFLIAFEALAAANPDALRAMRSAEGPSEGPSEGQRAAIDAEARLKGLRGYGRFAEIDAKLRAMFETADAKRAISGFGTAEGAPGAKPSELSGALGQMGQSGAPDTASKMAALAAAGKEELDRRWADAVMKEATGKAALMFGRFEVDLVAPRRARIFAVFALLSPEPEGGDSK